MPREPTVLQWALLILLYAAGGMAKHVSFPAGDWQELKVAAESQKVQVLQMYNVCTQLRTHGLGLSIMGLNTFACCICSPEVSATRTAAM